MLAGMGRLPAFIIPAAAAISLHFLSLSLSPRVFGLSWVKKPGAPSLAPTAASSAGARRRERGAHFLLAAPGWRFRVRAFWP